jgi:CheY-like chemotaxis protein
MIKQYKSHTHVFVVENNRLYVEMLDYIFSKDFSHRFVNFKSGEECLENLHLSPDIIVLDYGLPGINGLETLKEIRKDHPHIYIISLMSENDDVLPSQLFDAGADDYVLKGKNYEEMVTEKVENFLCREVVDHNYSGNWALRSVKKIYYALLALLAVTAGVYCYQ